VRADFGAQLLRMTQLPDCKVCAQAGAQHPPILAESKSACRVHRYPAKNLRCSHAEQHARHVHRQQERCDRRRTWIAIRRHGHLNAKRAHPLDRRQASLAQKIERTGQQTRDDPLTRHEVERSVRRVFQMIGR